jgi:hypothetical protein
VNGESEELEKKYANIVEKIRKLNLTPTGEVVGVIKRI